VWRPYERTREFAAMLDGGGSVTQGVSYPVPSQDLRVPLGGSLASR
jgi:hypothetical protein